MKAASKILVALIGNIIGLVVAEYFVAGFDLNIGYRELLALGVALTVLNLVLKPVIKLFFGPIIILTLGISLILVNAVILYILDIFSKNLTIESVTALIYSSLIVGAVNFVFHLATKK
ncbi:MAG: phage holin family protein [Candidatus Liptonbacteria bacterium]|nr:phage holin family protein [Candidatus Liptonbacteria bacterium]